MFNYKLDNIKSNDKINFLVSTKKITKNDIESNLLDFPQTSNEPLKLVTSTGLTNELTFKASFENNINNGDILEWKDNKIVT